MSFAFDLRRFAEKAGANAEQVVRKTTAELAKKVVEKTPVDTGRARANWQFGDGAMISGTLDETDKTGDPTKDRLEEEILRSRVGGVTYIQNNLPYALRLEYGWSKQAPSGMVRTSMAEVDQELRKAVGELDK